MSLFHRHCWQETGRRFVPPLAEFEAKTIRADLAREFFQGVTVVELRCEGCGDVAERKLSGDATHADPR